MYSSRSGGFLNNIPQVTKNLLIVNIAVFIVGWLFKAQMQSLPIKFELYNFNSENFQFFQLFTHMFMHGDIFHLFFNMFGLFMFGKVIESVIGGKKFFILYTISGIGAAVLHLLIVRLQLQPLYNSIEIFNNAPSPDAYWAIMKDYSSVLTAEGRQFAEDYYKNADSLEYAKNASSILGSVYNMVINIPMVGASGAIFGILAAFALMFPNVELMLMFIPVPIKAKYFVPIYAVMELFFGVANFKGDNIAHFAHLGGAIVGFILIKIWKKNQISIY